MTAVDSNIRLAHTCSVCKRAMVLERGTQIAYIPTHCAGDITHPDVEFGFVTSVRGDVAFCRYWSKYDKSELRTKANSEATPIDMVVLHKSVPRWLVQRQLKLIDKWEEKGQ